MISLWWREPKIDISKRTLLIEVRKIEIECRFRAWTAHAYFRRTNIMRVAIEDRGIVRSLSTKSQTVRCIRERGSIALLDVPFSTAKQSLSNNHAVRGLGNRSRRELLVGAIVPAKQCLILTRITSIYCNVRETRQSFSFTLYQYGATGWKLY